MIGDFVFFVGTVCALALLVYGGWLCIPQPEGEQANVPSGAKRGAAMRDAQRVVASHVRLGLFAAFSVIAALVPLGDALADEPFERGIQAYHESKYQDALAKFRVSAGAGNSRAQEILGFMYLHGQSAYGPAVNQDRAESIYWFGRAAKGGREVSQHMLCVLSGRPANTVVDRSTCLVSAASISSGRP